MPDREKIIADLSTALVQMHGCGRYTPEDVDELETAARGALKLLEEQEPVKWSNEYGCYVCNNCGVNIKDEVRFLMDKEIKYCPCCGRAVKWDAAD